MNNQVRIHNQSLVQFVINKSNDNDLKPYLEALKAKLVSDSSDTEVLICLSEAISKATLVLSHKAKTKEEHNLCCTAILEIIRMRFQMLTIGDLKLAILKGSIGDYGDIMGVNTAQVVKWLQAYKDDLKRHQAKAEIRKAQIIQPETKEWTDSDRKALSMKAFDEYKSKGSYDDLGNWVYDFLDRKNVINFSTQRKKEIEKVVKEIELKRLSMPRSLSERNGFKTIIEKIMGGDKEELRGKCKKHALNVFFADLIKMGIDLEIPD